MNSFSKNNMAKFSIILIFLVSLLVGPFIQTIPIVHAQTQAVENTAQQGASAAKPPADNSFQFGQFIGNTVLSLASYFTWVGGMLLEVSMKKLVLEMGSWINNDSVGQAIDSIWRTIRDICNLAFIFGFIYIGIRTIIDAGNSDTKRWLASIIIGALLINFSLFFAKIIIDASNYLAIEVYNSMTSGQEFNLSYTFAEKMGISTYFNPPTDSEKFANLTVGGTWSFYLMGAVVFMVAAFVFAAGGVLLIIRFVALILIMIFSPILFAATVFPGTEKYAKDLWSKLISYSFFAPVYLLLLLISIRMIEAVSKALKTGSMSDALTGASFGGSSVDSYTVILNFAIAIFFMIMSLQIAQKMGIAGADKVLSTGNALRNKAQSWAGRNTVGKLAKGTLGVYEGINSRAQNTRTGRVVGTALKWASLGALGDRSIRGTLETGKKAKFGGEYSRADDVTYDEEQKKRQATLELQRKFDEAIDLPNYMDDLSPEEKKKITIEAERAAAHAPTKYLEEITQEQRKSILKYLTQSQVEALNKSEKLTEGEKKELNDLRTSTLKTKYGNNTEVVAGMSPEEIDKIRGSRDNLSKANSDELESLGVEFLSVPQHAIHLNSSQMDDLKKKLTPTEYAGLETARKNALDSLATDDFDPANNIDGRSSDHILKMKPGEISKMPKEVLHRLATKLPIAVLSKIAIDGTLNKTDQAIIRERIIAEARIAGNAERYADHIHWLNEIPLGKQFGR